MRKKILFLENRYRTYAWQWMADFLEKQGCEVFWIVQNHFFIPRGKNVYIIPYPQEKDIVEAKAIGMPNDVYDYVAFTDRNKYIFGCNNTDYYYHYYNQIKQQIVNIDPDLVIGESTQFYELLAISICKERNFLYLHPSTCRYPVDRFAFYQYNTLEPYRGSGEEYSYNQALQLANDIANRSTQPSYMIIPPFSWKGWIEDKKDKLIKSYCYLRGEHYCTPPLTIKKKLNQHRDELVKLWESHAVSKEWESAIKNKFVIMYPMQMQPEANLDVWGYPYRNQAETIRKIADHLHEDEILVVKPNPKAKYELTDELMALLVSRTNIVIVPLLTPMATVFAKTDLVVVVTGTIAMECIVSNKPVVTLAKTMNNKQRNCPYLEDLMELRKFIELAKGRRYAHLSDDERVGYINELVRTSYTGSPYTTSSDEGMEKALLDILNH